MGKPWAHATVRYASLHSLGICVQSINLNRSSQCVFCRGVSQLDASFLLTQQQTRYRFQLAPVSTGGKDDVEPIEFGTALLEAHANANKPGGSGYASEDEFNRIMLKGCYTLRYVSVADQPTLGRRYSFAFRLPVAFFHSFLLIRSFFLNSAFLA